MRPPGTPWPKDRLLRKIWRYDGEIRYADSGLGQILDALEAAGPGA